MNKIEIDDFYADVVKLAEEIKKKSKEEEDNGKDTSNK
jgi:hypothetical protein